ncbi:hypothetical protein [Thermococcus thioreducens]|uniref:Uncharacterized protein n=1 Tax=Thermococcus thioreducens TaxID=277988 RepID=A0A0Q2M5R3_9EURY|nr:hypothetical protein [Thermococcus thioreducens]ASJ11389.1 hypothetical protein A3L14_00150 [Thermococcus thioreducens]KQH83409.1 hypothetical protein AMR53_00150 [Thermococcus thioreducens]SEW07525.1 hypothetical protein SAMN05216170_1409 [Thermococcus thioreducens]
MLNDPGTKWLLSWTLAGILGWFIGTFLMFYLLGSGIRPSAGWFVAFMVGWIIGGFIWYERRIKGELKGST